jgi:hypothetical protein
MILPSIDPLVAGAVVVPTAFTDAVYVLFNASVAARRRFEAAPMPEGQSRALAEARRPRMGVTI